MMRLLLSHILLSTFFLFVTGELAVFSDQQLYGWGANGYGQVGNGGITTAVSSPTLVVSTVFAGKRVKQIVDGYRFSIALLEDGSIYTWGDNAAGQLGNPTDGHGGSPTPVKVEDQGVLAGKKVIQVQMSMWDYGAAIVLTEDGKTFSWGVSYMLGADVTSNQDVPVAMKGDITSATVVQIAGGLDSSIALGSNGDIYTWGYNDGGEVTGDGTGVIVYSTMLLTNRGGLTSKRVVFVAASRDTSHAVTSDGQVYSWGANALVDGPPNPTTPTLVTGSIQGVQVVSIHCYPLGKRIYALSDQGAVHAWGDNDNGALGIGSQDPVQYSPVLIGGFSGTKVTQISVYELTTYALTETGAVYAWGNLNLLFQSSMSPLSTSSSPVMLSLPNTLLLAGWGGPWPLCFGLANASLSVCNGNGVCSEADTCVCNSDFTGMNCSIPICHGIPANSSLVCSGRGRCESDLQCYCPTRYSGDSCQDDCAKELIIDFASCAGNCVIPTPSDLSCSTYLISKSLTIPQGSNLTILPGTLLMLGEGVSLIVDGTLIANGDVAHPITFTSATPNSQWGSIRFTPRSKHVRFHEELGIYYSGNLLKNCIIENGGNFSTSRAMVEMFHSTAMIKDSRLRNADIGVLSAMGYPDFGVQYENVKTREMWSVDLAFELGKTIFNPAYSCQDAKKGRKFKAGQQYYIANAQGELQLQYCN